MPNHVKIQPGDVFGRLTVVSRAPSRNGRLYWNVKCECGNECEASGHEMARMDRPGTKSCGCLKKERAKNRSSSVSKRKVAQYGVPRGTEFSVWKGMIQRCTNPEHKQFASYGGRGITVCDEWLSFDKFYEDMAPRPEGLTLDRIDNNKGYSKENCRWATAKEQCNNRRDNVVLTIGGESKTMSQWGDALGINVSTLQKRLKDGMTIEEAVSAPIRAWEKTGAASFKNELFAYNGEEHTLSEWSKITGIAVSTLHCRIVAGWDLDKALSKKAAKYELTLDGETLSLAEWARRKGLSPQMVRFRINQGWSTEAALNTPARPLKKNA